MATELLEKNLLNSTLDGLRSTCKGNLRHDSDWKVDEDISIRNSWSFESFLNTSITDVNMKLHSLSLEDSSGSCDSKEGITEYDNTVEASTITGISKNYDVENEISIKQYHDDCRGTAEERKAEKAQILERRTEYLRQETENELKIRQEQLVQRREQFEEEIRQMRQRHTHELHQYKLRLDKQVQTYGQRLQDVMMICLTEESEVVKEEENKQELMSKLRKDIELRFKQVERNRANIEQKFTNTEHLSFVDAEVCEEIPVRLRSIIVKAQMTMSRFNASENIMDMQDLNEVMEKLIEATIAVDYRVHEVLKSAQERAMNAEKKAKELERIERMKLEEQKQKLEAEKKILDKQQSERQNKDVNPPPVKDIANKDIKTTNQNEFTQFISEKALVEHTQLQEHLNSVEASFKDFTSDSKHTKYIFDIKKAVNSPINALSAQSPQQLNNMIRRLVNLLAGNTVEVSGKQVNCNAHPCAMIFCKDFLAKKLVRQGAQQVSSNPESAFLYAAVIVAIWSAFPDVGKLILAHFHRSYPYIVPYYMPQVEGQTNTEYHEALGYSVKKDEIEDDDHFLKKFSGTVQLYAAVVSSKGSTSPDHPHGIDNGWTWLARTLNLKPQESITATMLFEFIKVSGHILMRQYRKQFQKLLLLLCKDYIPIIENVTSVEKRGPTQRFKDFLEECIKTQRIAIPKGYLSERWWQTGHF